MRDLDVKLAQDYVKMVDEQERKKKAEMEARDKRQRDFMDRMEATTIAGENRKAAVLENNLQKYVDKKDRENYLEEERRKKRVKDDTDAQVQFLSMQLANKNERKKVDTQNKTEFVQYWNDKIADDLGKEQQDRDNLKQKEREIQEFQLKQIEERKGKKFQMSQAEFEMNKRFLEDIANKK